MDAESLPRTSALAKQKDHELEELRALLARAERGQTPDDRCAAVLFRDLIRRRCDR